MWSEIGNVYKALLALLALAFLLLSGFRLGALPFIPGAPYSDAALSHWPATHHLRESVLGQGAFPIWRDGIMASQPFAANPLNKTAYPLQWLALIFPAAVHLDVMIALHGLIAGWGMWRWARRLGQGEAASAVAALGYLLGPRVLAHTGAGHLDLLYALAWWPWLMAALSFPSGQSTQWTLAHVLRVAVFAALLVLADVRLSLFALALAFAYALRNARQSGDIREVLRLWPVAPLLLALTASLVLPLLGWRPYLSRAGLTAAEAGVFSLSPVHLLGALGFPTDGANPELVTYTGLGLLVLAALPILRAPRKQAFWLGVVSVAMVYALGVNSVVWSALVQAFPTLLWFRVPARAWLVLAMVVPLLAGYGVDNLLAALRGGWTAGQRARGQRAALVLCVAFAVGGAFLLIGLPAVHAAALAFLAGGAAMTAVIWLVLGRKIDARTAAPLLLLVVFSDLALSGIRWLSWRGPDDWLLPGDAVAYALAEDDVRRVYAPYVQLDDGQIVSALPQPAAAAYELSVFGGVDPFQLVGFVDAVAQATGSAAAYDVVQPPIRAAADALLHDASILARWGVTHIAFPVALGTGWMPFDEVGGTFLYRLEIPAAALNNHGWPEGWANLPDTHTVERLNGMTLGAWAFSMALFVGCLAVLALLERRRARV